MILIRTDINVETDVNSYEQIYFYLNVLKTTVFTKVANNSIYVICNDEDDYFKICMELIMVINKSGLKAKLYISHSNEVITINNIDPLTSNTQIFKLNSKVRDQYLKNRSFKINEHFLIRAHHPTLDSILYSLSQMCFKHDQNIELLYDKYYNRLTQNQIAEKHNLSQVAVSKKLKSNNYEMFKLIVSRL